jgi:hypothetical protein
VTRRVALLVPDAGPLISLGRIDRLSLLLLLKLPIYLVDQVVYEVARAVWEEIHAAGRSPAASATDLAALRPKAGSRW